MPKLEPPEPTRLGEVLWREPYPDVLIEGLADTGPGPDALYETRESISLAFVTPFSCCRPANAPSSSCVTSWDSTLARPPTCSAPARSR